VVRKRQIAQNQYIYTLAYQILLQSALL
jgi:hypothetical protein